MSDSTKEVTEEVNIVICDICGEEITPEEVDEDSEGIGTIGNYKKIDPNAADAALQRSKLPSNLFGRLKFKWPSTFVRDRMKEEREEARAAEQEAAKIEHRREEYVSTHVPVEWYDFHGECLANLVVAASNLRQGIKASPPPRGPLADLDAAVASLETGAKVDVRILSGISSFAGIHPEPGETLTFKRTLEFKVTGKRS